MKENKVQSTLLVRRNAWGLALVTALGLGQFRPWLSGSRREAAVSLGSGSVKCITRLTAAVDGKCPAWLLQRRTWLVFAGASASNVPMVDRHPWIATTQ
jgi:hypothetical protein